MPQPTARRTHSDIHERRTALTLALFVLAVYLATTGLHYISHDEVATFAVARSLAGRASFDADSIAWLSPSLMGHTPSTVVGPDGHSYALKDSGTSLLAAPLVLIAGLTNSSLVNAAYLLTPIITSLTVGVMYLFIRWLEYTRATAVVSALALGLGSLAWPYARTLYGQPEASLGLLIALWGTIRAHQDSDWVSSLWAGAGIGLAGVSAFPLWLLLPLHVGYIVRWKSIRTVISGQMIRLYAAFGAGAGAFAVLSALHNWTRFGSLTETGHQLAGIGLADFSPGYLGVGIVGLLLSTPRGLLSHMPVALLAPVGFVTALRRNNNARPFLLAAGQIAIVVLIYGMFRWWMGGINFGPRYLVPVAPMLVFLAVPWLDHVIAASKWPGRVITGLIGLISIATQLMGSVLDFRPAIEWWASIYFVPTLPPTYLDALRILLDWRGLPQLSALRLIQENHWDVLWLSRGRVDWLLALSLAGAIACAGLGLWLALQRPASRWNRIAVWFQAILTLAVIGLMLIRYPNSTSFLTIQQPDPDGLAEVTVAVSELTQPGDALVLIQYPEFSYAWLDSYPGRVPDVGLTLQPTPDVDTMRHLMRIEHTYNRIWLITVGTVSGDPTNGVEQWLALRGFAGPETWIGAYRLIPYSFGATQQTLHSTNYVFGQSGIVLSGWTMETVIQSNDRWLNVGLQWRSVEPITTNYQIFVHIRDSAGQVVAQHDGQPQSGYSPMTTWPVRSSVDDRHLVLLPDNLPPGVYELWVGMYDSSTGLRVQLTDGQDSLLLTTIDLGFHAE